MSKQPATITKAQAAVLILCIALAALLLAASACVWIVRSKQRAADSVQQPASASDEVTSAPDDTARVGREIIANSTWIGEVDVSGMTEEQALNALTAYVAAMPDEVLTVTLPDRTLSFSGVRKASLSNAAALVRQAIDSNGGAITLTLDYTIQAGAIRSTLRSAAAEIAQEEGSASYELKDGTLYFTPGSAGVSLDTETLYQAVIDAYSQPEPEDFAFNYTEVSSPLEELTLLREQIAIAPQNARYDPLSTGISEAVSGWDIDMEQAARLLDAAEPGETVRIPMTEVPAAIDRETLKSCIFRESLGNCSSAYYYNPGRTTNLTLACQAINGTVIQPGEVFSFNDVVGERTADKGYQPGIVYIGGISEAELGGGVCQVASTIYCAALYANLEIVERTEHMYLVTYVNPGMDATVYWGSVDFAFRNSTDYPIQILANTNNGYVNVSLMGTEVTGQTVEMAYLILAETPWEDQVVEDKTKPVGYTYTSSSAPYNGYRVNTYRTVKDADGVVLSTALEASSIYAPYNRVTIVGAGTDIHAINSNAETVTAIEIPAENLTPDGQPVTVTEENVSISADED